MNGDTTIIIRIRKTTTYGSSPNNYVSRCSTIVTDPNEVQSDHPAPQDAASPPASSYRCLMIATSPALRILPRTGISTARRPEHCNESLLPLHVYATQSAFRLQKCKDAPLLAATNDNKRGRTSITNAPLDERVASPTTAPRRGASRLQRSLRDDCNVVYAMIARGLKSELVCRRN
jgi:hypothetical protein